MMFNRFKKKSRVISPAVMLPHAPFLHSRQMKALVVMSLLVLAGGGAVLLGVLESIEFSCTSRPVTRKSYACERVKLKAGGGWGGVPQSLFSFPFSFPSAVGLCAFIDVPQNAHKIRDDKSGK